MGTKERREREKNETRAKILDAARELFVEQGYEAVTMRKIADRIEYSPTAIYIHFKDKEELVGRLCENDFGELARQFQSIARIPDPLERLRRSGRAYAQFGLKYPNQYRFMFMTPHPVIHPDDSDFRKGDPAEDGYAFVHQIVKDCLAAGLLKKEYRDSELVTQTVWAGVHGVVAIHIAMQGNPWIHLRSAERAVKTMVDVLIAGLSKE